MDPLFEGLLKNSRALLFDFDGTLVDSNRIKWEAFEACFERFPQRREEILAYCRANNHTTRYEKFRWVYEKILRLPYGPETERELSAVFESHSTRQIIDTPEIPGAEGFIRLQRGKHLLGLLSSTPHPILLEILSHRGWAGYFDVVRGAPVDKAEFLRRFLSERRIQGGEAVFFGDTLEDARAAERAGWRFVAVGPQHEELKRQVWISDFNPFLKTREKK